jgi:hypothetical protein
MKRKMIKLQFIGLLAIIFGISPSFAKNTNAVGVGGIENRSLDLLEAEDKYKYLNKIDRVNPLKLRNGNVGDFLGKIQEKINEDYSNFDLTYKLDRREWFITRIPLSPELLKFLGLSPISCKNKSVLSELNPNNIQIIACQDNKRVFLDGTWIANKEVSDENVASLIAHEIMVLKLTGLAMYWSHRRKLMPLNEIVVSDGYGRRVRYAEDHPEWISILEGWAEYVNADMSTFEAGLKRVEVARSIVGFLFTHDDSYASSNILGETLENLITRYTSEIPTDKQLEVLEVKKSISDYTGILDGINIRHR